MPWGEWQAGAEYWGRVGAFSATHARWVGAWESGTGYGPASDATITSLWGKALAMDGVLSQPGPRGFQVISQATYDPDDSSQVRYQSGAYQVAVGFTNLRARQNPPDPELPPGATEYEVEGYVGEYLGGARLGVLEYELLMDGVLDVRMDLRVLAVPVSALDSPRAFDASGPTLFSTGAVAYPAEPTVIDVSGYADATSGDFVITSAPTVVQWSPPTVTEYYRGAGGDFSVFVEYLCRAPRVRYLYTNTPPPPPPPPPGPATAAAPPRRVYPRDDRSARRTAPASVAQQHSSRVVGGYL